MRDSSLLCIHVYILLPSRKIDNSAESSTAEVVTVNICRACDEERTAIVEYIDVDREAIAPLDGARLRIYIVNAVDKAKRCLKELVELVVDRGYCASDSETRAEK